MASVEIASAYVSLIPSFRGGQRAISNALTGPVNRASGDVSRSLTKSIVSGTSRAVDSVARSLVRGVETAGVAAGALFATSLFTGWDRVTTIESATKSLTLLLDDSAAAGQTLNDVLKVVQGTPFPLDQFAAGAQQLIGFGLEAEKVPGVLQAIADAASVQGKRAPEFASRLTEVFGQMVAQGNVTLQDVWRISDTGVNALAILANHFGVTRDEMRDMISSGAVPAGEAIDALTTGIIDGSDGVAGTTRAFGGLSQELGDSLSGAAANARTALARFGAGVLTPLSPVIRGVLDAFVALLDAGLSPLSEWLSRAVEGPAFKGFVEWLSAVPERAGQVVGSFGNLGSALGPLIGGFAALATSGLSRMLPFFGSLIPVVNPLVGIFAGLVASSPPLRDAFMRIVEAAGPLVVVLGQAFASVLESLVNMLIPPLTVVLDALAAALEFIGEQASWVAPAVVGFALAIRLLNAAMRANPIILVVSLLAVLVMGLISAWQTSETFRNVVTGVWDAIIGAVRGAVSFLTGAWNTISGAAQTAWAGLVAVANTVWPQLWRAIGPIVGLIVDVVRSGWETIRAVISAVMPVISQVVRIGWEVISAVVRVAMTVIGTYIRVYWAVISTVIRTAMSVISAVIRVAWNVIVAAINIAVTVIRTVITTAFAVIRTVITTAMKIVSTYIRVYWAVIRTVITTAVTVIRSVVTTAWNIIRTVTTGVWNAIRAFFTAVWNAIRGTVTAVVNGIQSFLTAAWNAIRNVATSIWNGIRNTVTTVVTGMRDRVVSIIRGLRDTIGSIMRAIRNGPIQWFVNAFSWARDRIRDLIDKVKDIVRGVRDTVRNVFDGLLGLLKAPFKAIFDWINDKIIDNLNKVTEKFGLTIPSLPSLNKGGVAPRGGGGTPVRALNSGGIVPGGGPDRDSVLAYLTPGEGVLTRRVTEMLGGAKGIAALNKLPKMQTTSGSDGDASGGIVDWVSDNVVDPIKRHVVDPIADKIGEWLKKGAAFAIDKILAPVAGWLTDLVPSGWAQDFTVGWIKELREKAVQWGKGEDDKAAAEIAPGGVSVGGPPIAQTGWARVLRSGYRIGRGSRAHGYPAQDFPAPMGTPIYAANAGRVTRSVDLTRSYGRHVMIDHAGIRGIYAHMMTRKAQLGDIVRAGELIGLVGSTGNSTGPHLHLELGRNDPLTFLRGKGVKMDTGGLLRPGHTLVYNGTGGDEMVLDREETKRYQQAGGADGQGNTYQFIAQAPMQEQVTQLRRMEQRHRHANRRVRGR